MIETLHRKLAAIMFTDMVGYTAIMQENEPKATALRDRSRDILRRYVGQHGGQILQFYGDGALSTFLSAIEATRCAMEIQQASREEPNVPVRIGIHVGDVVFEEEGIVGDGVNVASRVEQLAASGGICVSERVYDDIKNQPGMEAMSLGRIELKNVRRPIEIFALTGEGIAVPKEVPGKKKGGVQTHEEREPSETRERPVKAALPWRKRAYLYGGTAGLLVLLIVGGLYLWRSPEQVAAPASIAVLPFVNMSADPENEYFSDGMTEELINALSKIEGLRVASRTSAFVFKEKQEDIRAIGEQLNVTTVLEGSVRKAGTKLRITAQLINIADGFHLWSESYERDVQDIFSIQDEISRTIVNTLKVKLVGEPNRALVKRSTDDLEAYSLYLKGRFYLNKWTETGMKKGIQYFQQAIEKDPTYALPYAGLADSYNVLGAYTFLPPTEAFPKAEAAARKALELDDNLAEAHASLALVRFSYNWDWSAAEREFQRATELNPGYAAARHAYAVYLTAMGRFDEAIAEMKRSQELDPLSLPINSFVGWVFYFARQYDQAIEEEKKTLEMEPNFATAHFILGRAYLQKSMFDKAIAEFQEAITLSGGAGEETAVLGVAFAMSGKREETLDMLQQLKERSKREYVPWTRFAVIYAALGMTDEAFDSLQKAYEERSGEMVFLKVDPQWDSLRSDPRFTALLRKVELE